MGQKQSKGSEFRPDYSNFKLSSPLGNIKSRYDVLVIGSGYGGSVAASRCSRAGQKVCVLEKGKEWLPGDFPETELSAIKEIQMTIKGKKDLLGSPTNLYDVVLGDHVAILQGCGLGGGSLINANVALDADPRVFQDEVWPKELQEDVVNMNEIDRTHVYNMLKPTVYPEDAQVLHKMEAMKIAADHIAKDIEDIKGDDIFKRTPLYVNFMYVEKNHVGIPQPACIGCGNCCGGCNTGAKNTLNMNYLPDAKAHGAEIFTQVEVKYIVRDKENSCWIIHYVPHIQESFEVKELIVRADKVILGAGSVGSTNILMQSVVHGGLKTSPTIGQKFTTNGDTINFSYNGEKKIRPAGVELKNLKKGKSPGPAISSVIDMRSIPGEPVEDGLVLQDGTAPSCADAPYKFLISWLEKGEDTTPEENDWRERVRHWSGKGWKNTLCFLSMSHDRADGILVIDEKSGRVIVEYPDVGREINFEKVQQVCRTATHGLKGFFIANPYWHGLVSEIRDKKGIVTVHPLGGCSMAESGKTGVVNHAGQVFAGDTEELLPDLYVVDGAIMPRSLGVNPSLTISVLAERCIRLMAEKYGWQIDYTPFTEIDFRSVMVRPGIRFTERMSGELEFETETVPCEFLLTVETDDIEYFLNDERHAANIYGTVTCEGLSRSDLTISEGHFELFSESKTRVNTREMIYQMVLSSVEGKSYFFDGVKVVHKDSALEIGVGDTTTLSINIHKGSDSSGEVIARGKLKIRISDFRKQLKTMEVFNATTKVERLKWKARFGKFFAGVLWKIYGPLSTTKTIFNPDALPREKRPLELGEAQPVATHLFTQDDYELLLTRYQGGDKGPLLLVHGVGVSSSIFAIDTIQKNFIEYLVEKKYDVWNLDWRASINFDSCRQQWTCDDAGKYDFPLAVDHILNTTGKADLQVLVHCAGGIAFFISLLQGTLQGKIRSIVSSQTGPCLSASTFNSFKSAVRIPSFFHGVGIESMTAFNEGSEDWIDKVFFGGVADATTAFKEHCNSPVCHRITFIYHLLWNHKNLNTLTHDTLHEHFGYVNVTVLRHFGKIVNKGRVVTFQDEDIYLPRGGKSGDSEENEDMKRQMRYLDIPTMFCSGVDNHCWSPETSSRSLEVCRQANPDQHYERLVIPNYAHLDVFMGQNSHEEIFPLFMPFLDKYAYSAVMAEMPTSDQAISLN